MVLKNTIKKITTLKIDEGVKATGKLSDVLIISPGGGRNSTLSSECSPHEASQSGQGDGRDSNTSTSCRDHDVEGGGEGGFHDGSAVKDDSSIKV